MSTYASHRSVLLYFIVILAAVAGSFFLFNSAVGPDTLGVDDAFIFLAYAKNVLGGHGFVWHPVDGPIEGFTSWTWLALCILCSWLFSAPEYALGLLSCVLVSGAGALYVEEQSRVFFGDSAAGINQLLLCAVLVCWITGFPNFFSWAFYSIMDTPLWTALLMVSVVAANRFLTAGRGSVVMFTAALCALCLTRPEGFGVSIALIAAVLVLKGLARSSVKAAAIPFIGVVLTGAAATCIRLLYFGFPLPNTYYAKVGSNFGFQLIQGADYFFSFVMEEPAFAAAAVVSAAYVLGFFWIQGSIRAQKPNAELLMWGSLQAVILLCGVMLYIVVGGDHFLGWRQYQPFWPFVLGVLTAAGGLIRIRAPYQYTGVIFVLLLAGAAAAIGGAERWMVFGSYSRVDVNEHWPSHKRLRFEYSLAAASKAAGRRLNEVFAESAKPVVGAAAVGGIGLTYRGRVVDLMGINNVVMAHATRERVGKKNHAAFDKGTFYTLMPDLILHFGTSCMERKELKHDAYIQTIFRGLFDDTEFVSAYQPVIVEAADNPWLPGGLCGYVRRDYEVNLPERIFKRL